MGQLVVRAPSNVGQRHMKGRVHTSLGTFLKDSEGPTHYLVNSESHGPCVIGICHLPRRTDMRPAQIFLSRCALLAQSGCWKT